MYRLYRCELQMLTKFHYFYILYFETINFPFPENHTTLHFVVGVATVATPISMCCGRTSLHWQFMVGVVTVATPISVFGGQTPLR